MKKPLNVYVTAFLFILASLCFCSQGYSQVDVKKLGQSTMGFLKVGISPKAAAMGEAYTAVSEGAESMFYNPAGMTGVSSGFDVMAARTQWIANIGISGAAATIGFSNIGVFGLSVRSVDYGDIQGTKLLGQADPQGYEDTGIINEVGAYSVGLGYARQISDQFSMGGQVQYVSQTLGRNTTMGTVNQEATLAYDVGMRFATGFESLGLSMAIRNFSTAVTYEEVPTQLPLNFKFGATMDMLDLFRSGQQSGTNSLLISTEFTHPNNYTERVNVGAEYTLMEVFSIRSGYQFNHDVAGWSGGLGVSPTISGANVELNYSFSESGIFESIHRISIGGSF